VCVDQVVEGVHFTRAAPSAAVGWKACARALSDLAACAAEPRAVVLALRAPRAEHERRLRALIGAVDTCARIHGIELVGGDTCCAPGPLALTVTAIGESGHLRRPLSRRGAHAGQVVVATGAFGGSLLGRHLRPQPRFEAARWLAHLGATAMMDVSDGLALDLWRLARASQMAIAIGTVPIHADARRRARATGRSALQHALFDGEDHELVATLPQRSVLRALREAPERCPGFALLGNVRRGAGLRVPASEGSPRLVAYRGQGGFVHGR
jgi:thiamine-monophosphate kinase